jgi:hypothetical protein
MIRITRANAYAPQRHRRCVLLATAALAACGGSTAPKPMRPVAIRLATTRASATGSNGVEITGFRLVAGRASLGSGDQFGCADCQNNSGSTTDNQSQQIIEVPVNGGTVLAMTEDVSAGHYTAAQLDIESPVAATVAKRAGWPAGATMDIVGRFQGRPFELALTVAGGFNASLTPPLDVAAGATPPAPVSVTIALPVTSWFLSGSTPLDPGIPAQRAQIDANVRAALSAPESAPAAGES